MDSNSFGLMGFRHNSHDEIYAAFHKAPCGPFAFELRVSRKVAETFTREQQEIWARAQMRKRGAKFHGLFVSDQS